MYIYCYVWMCDIVEKIVYEFKLLGDMLQKGCVFGVFIISRLFDFKYMQVWIYKDFFFFL